MLTKYICSPMDLSSVSLTYPYELFTSYITVNLIRSSISLDIQTYSRFLFKLTCSYLLLYSKTGCIGENLSLFRERTIR